MKINFKVLILCIIIVFLVALAGSIFTSRETSGEWYESIKPSITPPNYIFPIVWNILFFLIALSLYFSWINAKNNEKKKLGLIFAINFILNILWSVIYFGFKNPLLAFIEIIFLEISIVFMIIIAGKIDKKAGYLLVPYLLWVGFASLLNFLSIQ